MHLVLKVNSSGNDKTTKQDLETQNVMHFARRNSSLWGRDGGQIHVCCSFLCREEGNAWDVDDIRCAETKVFVFSYTCSEGF